MTENRARGDQHDGRAFRHGRAHGVFEHAAFRQGFRVQIVAVTILIDAVAVDPELLPGARNDPPADADMKPAVPAQPGVDTISAQSAARTASSRSIRCPQRLASSSANV